MQPVASGPRREAEAPADAEAGREALLALVSQEEERLEELLARRLESESAAAEARLGFDDTAEGERLRRYQLACHRTLMRILEQLRKRRAERGEGSEARGEERRAARRAPAAPVSSPIENATNEPNAPATPPQNATNEPNAPAESPPLTTDNGQPTTDQQDEQAPRPFPATLAAAMAQVLLLMVFVFAAAFATAKSGMGADAPSAGGSSLLSPRVTGREPSFRIVADPDRDDELADDHAPGGPAAP